MTPWQTRAIIGKWTSSPISAWGSMSHVLAIFFSANNGANKPWVESLAEQLEAVRYKDRYLGVVFDKWDFQKGKNIVLELERPIDEARFVGIVVSKAMLE